MLRLCAILLVTLLLPSVTLSQEAATGADGQAEEKKEPETYPLPIYFVDQLTEAFEVDCGATRAFNRQMDDPQDVNPRMALKLLFEGPTPAEEQNGALYSFKWPRRNFKPLNECFERMDIGGGVARLFFCEEAAEYFDDNMCNQRFIRFPLYNTLLQFERVSAMEIYIGGVQFTDWHPDYTYEVEEKDPATRQRWITPQ